jgi:2-hydroxychromene-2-carboxylate isomerase
MEERGMSERTIEFFWDVGSPYTYLASTRINQIAQACNAQAQWRPFLLGGVFRETGNRPPLEVPAKLNYMLDDLKTWAAHYKMSFSFPDVFPINSLLPMRAAVGADRLGKGKEFAAAIMRTLWSEGQDPGLPENLNEAAQSVGLDGEKLAQMAQDPEIKDILKQNTAEAVERGAFGAPTFFVGKKMFWGHDRMLLLEEYLRGELPQEG